MEIVMEKRHPPRPPEPAASAGLSDYIWRLMENCWSYEASDRPSMQYVIRNLGKIKSGHLVFVDEKKDYTFLRRVDVLSIDIRCVSVLCFLLQSKVDRLRQ